MIPVLKVISYTLAPGASESDFLHASEAASADIATLDGYRERRLLMGEDGRWSDSVLWESRAAADASEARIATMPGCARCIGLMDHGSFRTELFKLVQTGGTGKP